jgi:hypothetical protein
MLSPAAAEAGRGTPISETEAGALRDSAVSEVLVWVLLLGLAAALVVVGSLAG